MCKKHSEISQNPSHFEGSAEELKTSTEIQANYTDYIKGMKFFDPHIHMTSRTTDDYTALIDAGVVAIIEPAFWLGQPRTGVDSFKDYFSSLVGWESAYSLRKVIAGGPTTPRLVVTSTTPFAPFIP